MTGDPSIFDKKRAGSESYFVRVGDHAECRVTIQSQAAEILSLRERVKELETAIRYALTPNQGDRHRPTVFDLAFTAFMNATRKNDEDGGPADWFNDTLPGIETAAIVMATRTFKLALKPKETP